WPLIPVTTLLSSTFFLLFLRPPPRSTLFPTRRSPDLSSRRWALEKNHSTSATSTRGAASGRHRRRCLTRWSRTCRLSPRPPGRRDRKSTRLNSSHVEISYAVFCLKKKNQPQPPVDTER